MPNRMLYCPYCGYGIESVPEAWINDNIRPNVVICENCRTKCLPLISQNYSSYYYEKAMCPLLEQRGMAMGDSYFKILEVKNRAIMSVLSDEAFLNPLYHRYDLIGGRKKEYDTAVAIRAAERQKYEDAQNHRPTCPTCGSTNCKKISASRKVAGGVTFGIFSKTAFSQYECLNCHYKW